MIVWIYFITGFMQPIVKMGNVSGGYVQIHFKDFHPIRLNLHVTQAEIQVDKDLLIIESDGNVPMIIIQQILRNNGKKYLICSMQYK